MSTSARRGVPRRQHGLSAQHASAAAGTPGARPKPRHRLLRRLLEGRYTWGDIEVCSSRYGYTSYCLVVYPPGSTSADRIRFRLLRSWPPLGVILGLVAVCIAAEGLPLQLALAIGVGVYSAGLLLFAVIAGPDRRRVRTLQTCRGDDGSGGLDRGPQDQLDGLVELLIDNEQRLRAGLIDAAHHEVVWGSAWDHLDSMRRKGA